MSITSTQIKLVRYPVGEPRDSDFEVVEEDLPELTEGQVLLRTLYLSLDPYMRGRISPAKSYAPPIKPGDVMLGVTVSEVIESRSAEYSVGEIVVAPTGWRTHTVTDNIVRRVDPTTAPISTAVGVLGMPGFTAYAGLLELGKPKAGETVVVAAATGPVGSAVGQIARLKGARAVGIAGGPEKCKLLIEQFGFDAAVDHRSPSFEADLAEATPDGIDVYYENVGGRVTEVVRHRLNKFGRVPLCGLVADYNETESVSDSDRMPSFMRQILINSLTVRGFIQGEFLPTHHQAFLADMTEWVGNGSVRYLEDVVDGLPNAVDAFRGLLTGKNLGKVVVKVAEPATTGL